MTSPPDLRPQLASAYDQAVAVASAVQAGQLADPTPCPAMDVRALLDHLVFAARRAAGLGRGETPSADFAAPHVDLVDVPSALRDAGTDATAAWSDDAALDRTITMPWGETYPGAALVGIYLVELATHSWDLAHATGNTSLLDDQLGNATLDCARESIRPEYRTPEGEPWNGAPA